MRRLVFTHIQKAAGNSVNTFFEVIKNQCGANVLALAGAASAHAKHSLLPNLGDIDHDDFDIITGHIPFQVARDYFAPATFVTVLRDPVERLLSDFCSQPQLRTLPDNGLSKLPDLLAVGEFAIDNLQVRMLCDNPRFTEKVTPAMLDEALHNLRSFYSLVGFVDRLDAFLADLSRVYGMPLPDHAWPRLNVTPAYLDKVSEEHRALVARHNELDAALFEWANAQSFIPPAPMAKRDTPGRKVMV